jgi:hypothetical protein
MPDHRRPTPLEKRTRKHLKAIRSETLKAARAIGQSYPNSAKSDEIIKAHQHRVQQIIGQGSAQPKRQPVCSVCGKPLPQSTELWTDSLILKFLYSLAVAGLFVLLAFLAEWWALLIFPIGWAVSQSFLWTITVPLSLLLIFILFMSLFGM